MDSPGNVSSVEYYFQPVLGCNSRQDVLSCHHMHIFEVVNYVILCGSISIFGLVANVINIIVFFRQGFTNTVNISFFGVAISDLCCLMTLLWVCLCLNPFIIKAGILFLPEDLMYLPGAWPHIACGRITSYITVFITAERCLSIIIPLKVKQIITPRRTAFVICLIYILNILTLVPEYATSYLAYTFIPKRNGTYLAMVYTSDRPAVDGVSYIISSITGISSFLGVVLWTVILVIKLQQSSKWRQQASNSREGIMSSREKKTIKMVAMIAGVLIVCYTPGSIYAMATFIEKELTLTGKYMNESITVWSFAFVCQSVNSSVNIFLYYRMSSNYRQTFDELFAKTLKLVNAKHVAAFQCNNETKTAASK